MDLRHFLDAVKSSGGRSAWLEVDRQISPRFETTAFVTALARRMRNPVIQFGTVEGSAYPIVTNVCCGFERVAKASGTTGDELQQRLINATHNPIQPRIVERADAPVRSRAMGDEPFAALPQLYYTDTQTHPYITAPLIVARDPVSGAHNVSFHRLMVATGSKAAIYMSPGGHLHQIWKSAASNGQRTPVAAVIGAHPLWCFGALSAGAFTDDDWAAIGAVVGEPMALVSSQVDSDLLIPADAEMVFEGFIEPEETQLESPFGEFLGYVAEPELRPVINFEACSSRPDPIFQDIIAGQAEHQTMSSVGLRMRFTRDYMEPNPALTDFWLPAPMTVFLSVDPEAADTFDRMTFMMELLQSEKYIKQVACFDLGVDLRKQAAVQSAMACNVQADRDLKVLAGLNGNGVDPSEIDDQTSKFAIDACAKKTSLKNSLPDSVLEGFDLSDWI